MPHTLLLADDSVTIQRVIELTFADEDIRVVAVGDGRHAIDRISHEPPDIVLADIGMPGSDGYEVAAFVKGRPDLAHIPVLLLTGAFEPVDEHRVREVRADGVLAKPFEPHELITRVKALLGGAGSPAAVSASAAPEALAGEDTGDEASPRDESRIPPAEGPGAALPPPSTKGGVSLDDYFDRLDAAFASLSVPSHIDEAAAVPPPPSDAAWRSHDAGSPGAPMPPPGLGAFGRSPAPPGAVTPATAFAAILEAELSGRPVLEAGPRAGDLPTAPTYPAVDELVEMVARRVIDRLDDQSLRDTVSDAVAAVAERLVREEIERLKATMK
jgi:CheY-like chemotaxis protein